MSGRRSRAKGARTERSIIHPATNGQPHCGDPCPCPALSAVASGAISCCHF